MSPSSPLCAATTAATNDVAMDAEEGEMLLANVMLGRKHTLS
jgi:hypothetical protein